MDYGNILSRAWRITWDHRVLWLFGLLASLSFEFRLNVDNLPPSTQQWLREVASHPAFGPVVAGIIVLSLLVELLLAVLNALGRAALVDQVNRIEEGNPVSASSGWEAGKRYGWRVFLIAFLLGLPSMVIILAGLVPVLIASVRDGWISGEGVPNIVNLVFLCFVPSCCLAAVLGIVLNTIGALAERTCVLEGRSVWQSIRGGWELLRDNLGSVGMLWLILLGLRIGISLILGIPACLLVTLAVVPTMLLMQESLSAGLAGLCGVAFLFWVAGTAVNSVIETFFSTCWTLGYRDLRAPKEPVLVTTEVA
ncbi:MAG: hypothetical protein H5T62_16165 [Anaerolineae bacterium]|nr:hypothetical protein [Anaerolineae bacterium]